LTPAKIGIGFLYQYLGRKHPGIKVRRLFTEKAKDFAKASFSPESLSEMFPQT